MLCPLLLDRRTSVYLQELPVPPTPPAPLPVPVRPCLGRPWSLPRMLRILRRPRSTSPCAAGVGDTHRATRGHQESLFRATRGPGAARRDIPCVVRGLPSTPAGAPRATTRVPTSPAGSRLHVRLHASAARATGRPGCCTSRLSCCTGRPCCNSSPAAQGCDCCSSGGQPALHRHPFEERLQDARYLPRRASISGAEDLP